MEIECDLQDNGQLDELEVQRYSDKECDDEYGEEFKIKAYRCSMDPWRPGKFMMMTYDPPPTEVNVNLIAAVVIGVIAFLCCCCIILAIACGSGKTKFSFSYSEQSDDDSDS